MTSFYAGPARPRLPVSTWDDVVSAVQTGATRETQWCELKEDIPATSPGANLELAKDLASLTVDGGVLLAGVKDNAATAADVIGIDTGANTGLSSRIDQIAASRVSPPMHVILHPIANPADPARTILLVEVPQSHAAPHMVDGKYWGRSATGKRPLSDEDVARLMSRRADREERFVADLEAMTDTVDWLPPDQRSRGRLHIIARPLVQPSVALTAAAAGKHPLELVMPAVRQHRPTWATSFEYVANTIAHPDGLAAASWPTHQWDSEHEDHLSFLQLRDDGTVLYASGDAVRAWDDDGVHAVISLPGIFEAIHQVGAVAAGLATDYLDYRGGWRIGIHITGLRGLYPSQRFHRTYGGSGFTPFMNDTYTRTATVTLEQLADPGSALVQAVAADLARGTNLSSLLPYTHVRELQRRLS